MRPTDPDQLAVALAELANVLDRCEPDDQGAVIDQTAYELRQLAQLCAAEADRPPMERLRELVALHVPHVPNIRAHG